MNNRTGRLERKTTDNITYPKGGVSCSANTFVQAESSVLRMKFSGENPSLLVVAKRFKNSAKRLC
ncbi:MAG: hypothetical protein WED33_02805 [Bacteroidia bacterium]